MSITLMVMKIFWLSNTKQSMMVFHPLKNESFKNSLILNPCVVSSCEYLNRIWILRHLCLCLCLCYQGVMKRDAKMQMMPIPIPIPLPINSYLEQFKIEKLTLNLTHNITRLVTHSSTSTTFRQIPILAAALSHSSSSNTRNKHHQN